MDHNHSSRLHPVPRDGKLAVDLDLELTCRCVVSYSAFHSGKLAGFPQLDAAIDGFHLDLAAAAANRSFRAPGTEAT